MKQRYALYVFLYSFSYLLYISIHVYFLFFIIIHLLFFIDY